jgi:hypothetical protein
MTCICLFAGGEEETSLFDFHDFLREMCDKQLQDGAFMRKNGVK